MTTEQHNYVVIGCGAMGAAISHALIRKRICAASELTVCDRDEGKLSKINAATGCVVVTGLEELRNNAVIVLAVKPQDFESLSTDLQAVLRPSHLIISIMAGVTIAKLAQRLNGHSGIIRSMPNLPAQCGSGMTAYFCHQEVSQSQQQQAQFLFESFGRSLRVDNEKLIDAATAISGTGPAYFYFLLQQMQAVATEAGFSAAEAELLLQQTMEGSLALWRETGKSPQQLIAGVASRGGTTEAAIKVLNNGKAGDVMTAAIRAAHERSRSLST